MTIYGENGECFVRLCKDGKEGRNFTVSASSATGLALYVKKEFCPSNCRFEMYYDGKDCFCLGAKYCGERDGYAVFAAELTLDTAGLVFYRAVIDTCYGVRYSSDDGGNAYLSETAGGDWQLLVVDRLYRSPEWLTGGVFYHIFIDRFAKGGDCVLRDDALMIDDWDNGVPEYNDGRHEFKNNTFFGGTLIGAAEKLDYLKSLGVTCVYLSPCFKAYSNHKYDIGDYMQVDEMFGGDEALKHFIAAAKERSIDVILDGVFNHVGDDSVYFDKYKKYGGACCSVDSPYYTWFDFSSYPDKYDCWWGMQNLPKVKRNRAYRDFICKTVVPHYMAMGIAGWRLDVADELEADFLDELTAAVKGCKPDALVLGEVWEDASNKIAYDERKRYFCGAQLDSVMNYPLRNGIISLCLDRDSSLLKYTLRMLWEHYPPEQMSHLMNILGTHDTERILTVLGGENVLELGDDALACKTMSYETRERAKRLFAVAYTLLAFMPGVPCIFYGDEIGMEGYHDPFCRRPYKWNNADGSLRKTVTAVNNARHACRDLLCGELTIYDTEQSVFAMSIASDGGKLLAVANLNDYQTDVLGLICPAYKTTIYKLSEDNQWSLML